MTFLLLLLLATKHSLSRHQQVDAQITPTLVQGSAMIHFGHSFASDDCFTLQLDKLKRWFEVGDHLQAVRPIVIFTHILIWLLWLLAICTPPQLYNVVLDRLSGPDPGTRLCNLRSGVKMSPRSLELEIHTWVPGFTSVPTSSFTPFTATEGSNISVIG